MGWLSHLTPSSLFIEMNQQLSQFWPKLNQKCDAFVAI